MTAQKLYPHTPDWYIAPGETIAEVLEFKGMTQKELAERLGISPKHVNHIMDGSAPITPDMAVLLERATGLSARIINALERTYQTRKAAAVAKAKLTEDHALLKIPAIKELIRRNIIPDTDDKSAQVESVLGFYGAGTVKQLKELWKKPHEAALRHSPTFQSDPVALATWLRLGERAAENILCEPYDKERFNVALKEIRGLTVKRPAEFRAEMVRLCANSGVALAFVPEIKGASLNGATKWIKKTKALIVLNLRGHKNDISWFTFFHEAAHVLFDSKKMLYVETSGREPEKSENEQRADRFAADLLIPPKFHAELKTLQSTASVRAFARKLGIAPGIVVGRLQHEKIIPPQNLNALRQTFRWVEK